MRGTRGYLAPEWISGVAITAKADVYSYGMMLFELVSGRRNTEQLEKERVRFFPSLAATVLTKGGDIWSLLDERLVGEDVDIEELTRACKVACWCIQDEESHRPAMSQVVQILEGVLEVNTPPFPRSIQALVENDGSVVFFTESSSSSSHNSSEKQSHSSSSSSSSSKKTTENITLPFSLLTLQEHHSLTFSPHLYSLRSQRGNIEPCLYLYQSSPSYDSWYTLDQTLINSSSRLGDESSLSLIPPSSSTHPLKSSTTVAVGFEIYQIGGTINKRPSSAVRVLDCRTHTWRDAPDMTVARKFAKAAFIDGKIIVIGGTEDAMNWVEIFDVETQTWTSLPSPNNAKANLYGGKLYVRNENRRYVYDHKEGTWKVISPLVHGFGQEHTFGPRCVIEDVKFSFDSHTLIWYDSKKIIWKRVWGLEELPVMLYSTIRLANYCGKLIILWDEPRSLEFPTAKRSRLFGSKRIWCAVIRLEKSLSGLEILGKIERSSALATVPNSYNVLCCVTL